MRGLLVVLALLLALPSLADDALARVRARGVLRIVTDATYPPFESKVDDRIVGFDRDIGDAIGKALGVKVEWQTLEWSGVLPSLETDRADLVLSGVTIKEDRKKAYAFSRPYFLSGQILVRRKGERIETPADVLAQGRTAAVQNDTTGQSAMEKAGLPLARIHRFDTLQDALLDVRNGKSTVAVGDLPALKAMMPDYPELEFVPRGVFVSERLGIAAGHDSRDLIAAVNTALDRILVDGTYAAALEKWTHDLLTPALVAQIEAVKGEGTPIPADIAAAVAKPASPSAAADAPPPPASAVSIRWSLLPRILPGLLEGARLTVELTALSILLGIPMGLGVALCRLAPFPPLRWLASVYVEALRGTPLLVQIFLLYFVVPAVLPALGDQLGPFTAGLMALSLNAAAYISEIFRAGIESIDTGQREAARALGMSGSLAMRHVILPQTIRRVLPPLTNEAVALLKDSSLVSVVALSELARVGKETFTRFGSPTTVYLTVALIYLCMTLPLTYLVGRLERRFAFERRRK